MTEKKLEKVEFGFENVESGEVSGDAIQEMKIVGLHQVGHRDFNDGYVSFTENLEADSFFYSKSSVINDFKQFYFEIQA